MCVILLESDSLWEVSAAVGHSPLAKAAFCIRDADACMLQLMETSNSPVVSLFEFIQPMQRPPVGFHEGAINPLLHCVFRSYFSSQTHIEGQLIPYIHIVLLLFLIKSQTPARLSFPNELLSTSLNTLILNVYYIPTTMLRVYKTRERMCVFCAMEIIRHAKQY